MHSSSASRRGQANDPHGVGNMKPIDHGIDDEGLVGEEHLPDLANLQDSEGLVGISNRNPANKQCTYSPSTRRSVQRGLLPGQRQIVSSPARVYGWLRRVRTCGRRLFAASVLVPSAALDDIASPDINP